MLVLVGPTATGKSAVAVEVAVRLDGEVITGDPQQAYRGMDIGTAKPSLAERKGVPHHLLDIKDPTELFTVAEFQRLVWELAPAIRARGRLPMLVGGTGLYVTAVLDAYDFPPLEPDWELRARLRGEAEALGPEALHGRLAEVDPSAAARLHPNDLRRVIRALEVYYRTGQPLSATWDRSPPEAVALDALVVGLFMDRDALDRRIEARVQQQLDAGLLEEVAALYRRGLDERYYPLRALGYRELLPVVRGERSLEQARADLVRSTRRLARRQLTWFRRDPRVRWLRTPADNPLAVVEAITRLAQEKWGRRPKS